MINTPTPLTTAHLTPSPQLTILFILFYYFAIATQLVAFDNLYRYVHMKYTCLQIFPLTPFSQHRVFEVSTSTQPSPVNLYINPHSTPPINPHQLYLTQPTPTNSSLGINIFFNVRSPNNFHSTPTNQQLTCDYPQEGRTFFSLRIRRSTKLSKNPLSLSILLVWYHRYFI